MRALSPEVRMIVNFAVASEAARERAERAADRVRDVELLGARVAVHRDRVDALAAGLGHPS